MNLRGAFAWVILLSCLLPCTICAQTAATSPPDSPSPTIVIALHGAIDDYSRDTLLKHFAQAKSLSAKVVILDIDTYGGLVTAALDISRFLKRQNDLHIVAFVDDKAISAGAMIAMACDEIVMTPGSVIGDCAPIAVSESGNLEPLPAAERAKMESPILADFYDSAVRNGHNVLLSEAMVAVGRSVYYVQRDSNKRFVSADDYNKLTKEGWQPVANVPSPVDSADTLLTVHADLAQKLGLARELQPSAQSLAAARGYSILARLEPSPGEKFIGFLGSAAVRAILLVIFLQALYIAFQTPGHGAPEAVAVVALALLLGVPLLTGYAQWYEIVMILGGLALLAFEILVFPGHMVSATLGIMLMVVGFVLTFVPKEPSGIPGTFPSLAGTYTALRTGLIVVVGGLVVSLALWAWLSRYLPHIPYFGGLVLTSTSPTPHSRQVATGPDAVWPPVGAVGTTVTDLRPGGSAMFPDPSTGDTRVADVVSETGFVPKDSKIVVREFRGSYAVVRGVRA